MTWSDPELAAKWANDAGGQSQCAAAGKAIEESRRSIEYLKREGEKTNVVAVQEAIGKLTEEQVKSVMLANVRDEYAFKVIDPAVDPGVPRHRQAATCPDACPRARPGLPVRRDVAFGREYQSTRR